MATDRDQQLSYIKTVLAITGWTRTDLAHRAGLDPSTLSRFLKGEREDHALRDVTMMRISQASGVAIDGVEAVAGFSESEAQPVDLTENVTLAYLMGRYLAAGRMLMHGRSKAAPSKMLDIVQVIRCWSSSAKPLCPATSYALKSMTGRAGALKLCSGSINHPL